MTRCNVPNALRPAYYAGTLGALQPVWAREIAMGNLAARRRAKRVKRATTFIAGFAMGAIVIALAAWA